MVIFHHAEFVIHCRIVKRKIVQLGENYGIKPAKQVLRSD
jgi:hypothetical protein